VKLWLLYGVRKHTPAGIQPSLQSYTWRTAAALRESPFTSQDACVLACARCGCMCVGVCMWFVSASMCVCVCACVHFALGRSLTKPCAQPLPTHGHTTLLQLAGQHQAHVSHATSPACCERPVCMTKWGVANCMQDINCDTPSHSCSFVSVQKGACAGCAAIRTRHRAWKVQAALPPSWLATNVHRPERPCRWGNTERESVN